MRVSCCVELYNQDTFQVNSTDSWPRNKNPELHKEFTFIHGSVRTNHARISFFFYLSPDNLPRNSLSSGRREESVFTH
jgi:hypothetical protein